MVDCDCNDRHSVPDGASPAPNRLEDTYSMKDFLGSSLYRLYRDIACREQSSILAVVRDVLRKNAETAQ